MENVLRLLLIGPWMMSASGWALCSIQLIAFDEVEKLVRG